MAIVTGLYAPPARSRSERKQSRQHQRVKFYVDMIDSGWNHRFVETVSKFLAMRDRSLYQDVIGIDGLLGPTRALTYQRKVIFKGSSRANCYKLETLGWLHASSDRLAPRRDEHETPARLTIDSHRAYCYPVRTPGLSWILTQ